MDLNSDKNNSIDMFCSSVIRTYNKTFKAALTKCYNALFCAYLTAY